MQYWSSAIASLLSLFIGVVALAWGTDSGQAWTAESARRLKILEQPILLPVDVSLINQQGEQVAWAEGAVLERAVLEGAVLEGAVPEATRQLILMEFIYTRCPTICLAMGAEFRQLQLELQAQGYGDEHRIQLLSVSFDPQDNTDDLKQYLQRFSANPSIWSAAKFSRESDLETIKQKLGLIVIPEASVGYIHNSAVYVIDNGKVIAILDHDDREGIDKVIAQYQLGTVGGGLM